MNADAEHRLWSSVAASRGGLKQEESPHPDAHFVRVDPPPPGEGIRACGSPFASSRSQRCAKKSGPRRGPAILNAAPPSTSRVLAGDAVLHPAVLLDPVDAELLRVRTFLALGLLHFVGVAAGGGRGGDADKRCKRKCCDDRGQAHGLLLEGCFSPCVERAGGGEGSRNGTRARLQR